MKKYISCSENKTIKIGKLISKKIRPGMVIFLNGDLGAGKTAITKGFAKGLKIKEKITSPTFTIMNEYTSGKFPLYHFDLYRIDDISEIYEIGLLEYLSNNNQGVCIIEWAEKLLSHTPEKLLTINIRKTGDETREISIEELE